MSTSALVTPIELLSSVPYFDEVTGRRIAALALSEIEADSVDSWATEYISALFRNGAIETVGDLQRIPDPYRRDYRTSAMQHAPDLYRASLNLFAQEAEQTMRPALERVVGARAALVTAQAARVVANPDEGEQLDRLVGLVHDSKRLGRTSDAELAASMLRTYSDRVDRRLLFFEGLAAWQRDERTTAVARFTEVLADRVVDRAEGVAAHLLAIEVNDSGDHESAMDLLERSRRALKSIGDSRGLMIVGTTGGRILRDRYLSSGDPAFLHRAIEQYEGIADSVPEGLNSDPQTAGRVFVGLAQCYSDLSQLAGDLPSREKALAYGRQAIESFEPSSYSAEWARVVLAGVMRDAGSIEGALELLGYDERGLDGFPWTKWGAAALNVTASLLRRQGSLESAVEFAKRSVEVGEFLGDRRAVLHALSTLIAVQMDTFRDRPTEDGLDSISKLIVKAINLARVLRDPAQTARFEKDLDLVESLRR